MRCILIITGNYNYLCSVPCRVLHYCNEICFCFCVMFRTGSPPPQTKTLKTKRVFLYRVLRLCSIRGKVIENFVASLSFVLLRRFELLYIYANRNVLSGKVLRGELVETWRI